MIIVLSGLLNQKINGQQGQEVLISNVKGTLRSPFFICIEKGSIMNEDILQGNRKDLSHYPY